MQDILFTTSLIIMQFPSFIEVLFWFKVCQILPAISSFYTRRRSSCVRQSMISLSAL